MELSTEAQDYDAVNNIGNILIQFIKMLGQDAYNKNRPDVDIFIHPDLEGYNMLSFSDEAIGTMIDRGYEAACNEIEHLEAIKAKLNGAKPRINHHAATDISQTPVSISSVEFNGVSDKESKMLMKKIGEDIGRVVDKDGIDAAMQKIQATKAFETVTYSLYGTEEPYRLVFNCEKGPVHQFGVGFRMDTKEWVSALLNVGLNSNRLKGSKLDFEACINKNFYSTLHYSLDRIQDLVYRDIMMESIQFCGIIQSKHPGYKWPKLQEIHNKLFGCQYAGGHNSESDTEATEKCFWGLVNRGIINK